MYTSDELDDMSMEQLTEAFKAAKAEAQSPTTQLEESSQDANSDEEFEEESEFEENEDSSEEFEEEDNSDAGEEQEQEQEEEEENSNDDEGAAAAAEESSSDTESTAEKAEPKKFTFTAAGKKYDFTEDEMREAFPKVFGQAMDYTQKMQAIAPWRRTIDAIEQAKLNHEDVNLMIDVLKGDKEAIAAVLKRTGVDTLDINTDEVTYQQKDYGRTDSEIAITDVIDSIKHDQEYATTHRVLTSEWDEASWLALASTPERIRQLHIDIKDGTFAKLQPEADKIKVFDGGRHSDLDYYIEAGRRYFQAQQIQEQAATLAEIQNKERQQIEAAQTQLEKARQNQQHREAAQQNASRRRAAAHTGRAAPKATVTNYLDASDDDYNERYNELQASL